MWTLCCPEFGRYKILLMTNIFVSAYFERISIKIWLNWQLVLKNLGWAVDFDIEWRWFWVTSHCLHNYCLITLQNHWPISDQLWYRSVLMNDMTHHFLWFSTSSFFFLVTRCLKMWIECYKWVIKLLVPFFQVVNR